MSDRIFKQARYVDSIKEQMYMSFKYGESKVKANEHYSALFEDFRDKTSTTKKELIAKMRAKLVELKMQEAGAEPRKAPQEAHQNAESDSEEYSSSEEDPEDPDRSLIDAEIAKKIMGLPPMSPSAWSPSPGYQGPGSCKTAAQAKAAIEQFNLLHGISSQSGKSENLMDTGRLISENSSSNMATPVEDILTGREIAVNVRDYLALEGIDFMTELDFQGLQKLLIAGVVILTGFRLSDLHRKMDADAELFAKLVRCILEHPSSSKLEYVNIAKLSRDILSRTSPTRGQ